MDLKNVFEAKASKYNRYQQCDCKTEGRRCVNCFRWRFSFPYTCNDMSNWGNEGMKAETCLNYTEDKNCPIE